MIETYNIPLIMNQKAFNFWYTTMSQSKEAYNECAKFINSNKIPLSIKNVHNQVYDWMRKDFDKLPAQSIIKIYKDVISAFRSIKKNKHEDAKIPERKNMVMRLDKRLYSSLRLEGIVMSTGTPHKRELINFDLYPKAEFMLKEYVTHDPTIFERNGVMYLSVPFEVPEKPTQNDTCIGVDLGMRQLFVTSEGYSFRDTKYLERRRQVRYLKKKLKDKKTKSSKRHLKKIKHKERNLSKDMCYRATDKLLKSTNASFLIFEDLEKLKQKTKNTKDGFVRKKHNNAISQVPFYQFRMIATYKAQLAGKRVETVSPTNTSKKDNRTGRMDGIRKGRRYICSDGVVFDADWNAAINIGKRAKHPISSSVPYDGALKPLMGRPQSTDQSFVLRNENLQAAKSLV